MGRYLGADVNDLPAKYREHAALVSDGDLPRPERALLFEFDRVGQLRVYQFGPAFDSNRDAIAALLSSATVLNKNASN